MNYSVVKIFCLSLVFLFLGNTKIHAQDSKCTEFFRAMEYEKAIICLEKNQPTSAEGWRMLGEAYRLSGQASKAFRMYDRVLKNYDEEVLAAGQALRLHHTCGPAPTRHTKSDDLSSR